MTLENHTLLLTTKQQGDLQDLLLDKIPVPRFDNLPYGFDIENCKAEAKMRTYKAVIKKGQDIPDIRNYYRQTYRNLVIDELKKHYRVRFTSLDDSALRPGQLDKYLLDTKPAEQMMDNVNYELLKAKFLDSLEKLTGQQKNLVIYWLNGTPKEQILRETGLSYDELKRYTNAALYRWREEVKLKLKKIRRRP